ncbi:MAG: vitamin K epoxide reductase family protein [Candidatus Woesearchaeota archaeon]
MANKKAVKHKSATGASTKRKSGKTVNKLRSKQMAIMPAQVQIDRKLDRIEHKIDRVAAITTHLTHEEPEHKVREMKVRPVLSVMLFLLILGLLVSIYLTWLHFKPSIGSFCSINETFDCITVAKSGYSSIFGVPVSFIGILGYITMIVICVRLILKESGKIRKLNTHLLNMILLVISSLGVMFMSYLTVVQAVVIKSLCVMCLVIDVVIFSVFILSVVNHYHCMHCREKMEGTGRGHVCRSC